jgi:tRNA (cmo5U34)-methyltransferase
VTVLLANPGGRFPLACGANPLTLGLRVPVAPNLQDIRWPVLQSSANLAGRPEALRLADVPEQIRRRADMVIDGGDLPGVASTVVDLRDYEDDAEAWRIVRQGAVGEDEVRTALQWQFHFDPATYPDMIRKDIPAYDRLQDELAHATGGGARRMLELGTGTGETAGRLLARHPEADLVGIDESITMLGEARARLPAERVALHVSRLEDELPTGPFDVVASALCVHHLAGPAKRELFQRIRAVLVPGGRFVLADVVVAPDPDDVSISLTPGFDHPSSLAEQLEWLEQAGFSVEVTWRHRDLAVVVAQAPEQALGG